MLSRVFEVNKPWTEEYLDFFEIVLDRMGFGTTRRKGDLIVDILSTDDEYILNRLMDYDIL